MRPLFITGIGTGIGKTLISAIITEKLQADYWKPIQAGDLDSSDTMTVKSMIFNPVSRFHPERYRLTQPFSPHKSAALDNVEIRLSDFQLPVTANRLVIEGAGGLMVPLNDKELMLDLILKFDATAVIVSMNYLGSINHTLLTANVLQMSAVPVAGVIFNGVSDDYSEKLILSYTGLPLLGRIPLLDEPGIGGLTNNINL